MIQKIKNIFGKLFRKKPKEASDILNIKNTDLASTIMWQSMFLQEDEILVYKDKEDPKVHHYFSTRPIDPEKEYRIIYIDDLNEP